MNREHKILATLSNDLALWELAAPFPSDCFSSHARELFIYLREHYLRYGSVMDPDAINARVKASQFTKDEKKEILKLYYTVKGMSTRATGWDLDALREEHSKEALVDSITNALKALDPGVEVKGRFYVGVEGATALLDHGKMATKESDAVDPFDAYQSRKNSGEKGAVVVPLFNTLIPSLQYGELWILVGFAGHGKTTIALNMSHGVASRGDKVLYLSLETPKHVAEWKLASIRSRFNRGPKLPYRQIKSGGLSLEQEAKLKELLDENEKNFRIVELPMGSRIGELSALMRALFTRQHYSIVFVDYLGALGGSSVRSDAFRYYYLGQAICSFKEMAKSFKTVIVLLHQANRKGWEEAEKKGFYVISALAETNEGERTADGLAWVMRTSHLHSRIGLMKYRDDAIDLSRTTNLILDPDTHSFEVLQAPGPAGIISAPEGWGGESQIGDLPF